MQCYPSPVKGSDILLKFQVLDYYNMKNPFLSEAMNWVAKEPSFTAFLQFLSVSVGGILALVNYTEEEKKAYGQAAMPVLFSIASWKWILFP